MSVDVKFVEFSSGLIADGKGIIFCRAVPWQIYMHGNRLVQLLFGC